VVGECSSSHRRAGLKLGFCSCKGLRCWSPPSCSPTTMVYLAILALFSSVQVHVAPAVQDAELLAAVLLHINEQLGPVVLVTELEASRVEGHDLARSEKLSESEAAALASRAAAQSSAPIDWTALCRAPLCRPIAPHEVDAILAKATSTEPNKGWDELRARFGSSVVIDLRAPVEFGDKAVVYWSETRGLLSGRLVLSVLVNQNGRWSVVEDLEVALA